MIKTPIWSDSRTVRTFILLAAVVSLPACAKLPREISAETQGPENPTSINSETSRRININTAPANELERLPGVGKVLAARIVEHRQNYGAFRRPEELIIVRGISDRKFRALRALITTEQ